MNNQMSPLADCEGGRRQLQLLHSSLENLSRLCVRGFIQWIQRLPRLAVHWTIRTGFYDWLSLLAWWHADKERLLGSIRDCSVETQRRVCTKGLVDSVSTLERTFLRLNCVRLSSHDATSDGCVYHLVEASTVEATDVFYESKNDSKH